MMTHEQRLQEQQNKKEQKLRQVEQLLLLLLPSINGFITVMGSRDLIGNILQFLEPRDRHSMLFVSKRLIIPRDVLNPNLWNNMLVDNANRFLPQDLHHLEAHQKYFRFPRLRKQDGERIGGGVSQNVRQTLVIPELQLFPSPTISQYLRHPFCFYFFLKGLVVSEITSLLGNALFSLRGQIVNSYQAVGLASFVGAGLLYLFLFLTFHLEGILCRKERVNSLLEVKKRDGFKVKRDAYFYSMFRPACAVFSLTFGALVIKNLNLFFALLIQLLGAVTLLSAALIVIGVVKFKSAIISYLLVARRHLQEEIAALENQKVTVKEGDMLALVEIDDNNSAFFSRDLSEDARINVCGSGRLNLCSSTYKKAHG